MSEMRERRVERRLAVLAASVRVRDIAEPVYSANDTSIIDHVEDEMLEDELWYCIVHQGDGAIGYFELPWLETNDIWTPLT